jgi:hypothetical protein
MRLEHRSDKVAPLQVFLVRMFRYGLVAGGIIFISLAGGTIGYRLTCGISWVDSFYMASMILTGMGPVTQVDSVTGKLFSSFFALYSGIMFLSATAVFLSPLVHRLMHILHVDK